MREGSRNLIYCNPSVNHDRILLLSSWFFFNFLDLLFPRKIAYVSLFPFSPSSNLHEPLHNFVSNGQFVVIRMVCCFWLLGQTNVAPSWLSQGKLLGSIYSPQSRTQITSSIRLSLSSFDLSWWHLKPKCIYLYAAYCRNRSSLAQIEGSIVQDIQHPNRNLWTCCHF